MTILAEHSKRCSGTSGVRRIVLLLLLVTSACTPTQNQGPESSSVWSHRMPGASDRQIQMCLGNLEQIVLNVKLYSEKNGKRPDSLSELTTGEKPYLDALPVCPVSQTDTYSPTYAVAEGADFTVGCGGENHLPAGAPAGFPKFESKNGFLTGLNTK